MEVAQVDDALAVGIPPEHVDEAAAPEDMLGRIGVARVHRLPERLVRAGEEHLRRQGACRITALVGYDDATAAAFWDSAGYPQDREIGRRVHNL